MTKTKFVFTVCICMAQLSAVNSLSAMENIQQDLNQQSTIQQETSGANMDQKKHGEGDLTLKKVDEAPSLSNFAVGFRIKNIPCDDDDNKLFKPKYKALDELPKSVRLMNNLYNKSIDDRDYLISVKNKAQMVRREILNEGILLEDIQVKPLNDEQIQEIKISLLKHGFPLQDKGNRRAYCLSAVDYNLVRIYPPFCLMYSPDGSIIGDVLNKIVSELGKAGFNVFENNGNYWFTHPEANPIEIKQSSIQNISKCEKEYDVSFFKLTKTKIFNIKKYMREAGTELYVSSTVFYARTFKLGQPNAILIQIWEPFGNFNKNEKQIIEMLESVGFKVLKHGRHKYLTLEKYRKDETKKEDEKK